MSVPTRLVHKTVLVALAALVLTLAFAVGASAMTAQEMQRTSLVPYYSVVRDKPFAPYTTEQETRRTSIVAYYSVVKDLPYAPYTSAEELKRTSLIPYWSVLH
jgi:hypothetical protein